MTNMPPDFWNCVAPARTGAAVLSRDALDGLGEEFWKKAKALKAMMLAPPMSEDELAAERNLLGMAAVRVEGKPISAEDRSCVDWINT